MNTQINTNLYLYTNCPIDGGYRLANQSTLVSTCSYLIADITGDSWIVVEGATADDEGSFELMVSCTVRFSGPFFRVTLSGLNGDLHGFSGIDGHREPHAPADKSRCQPGAPDAGTFRVGRRHYANGPAAHLTDCLHGFFVLEPT